MCQVQRMIVPATLCLMKIIIFKKTRLILDNKLPSPITAWIPWPLDKTRYSRRNTAYSPTQLVMRLFRGCLLLRYQTRGYQWRDVRDIICSISSKPKLMGLSWACVCASSLWILPAEVCRTENTFYYIYFLYSFEISTSGWPCSSYSTCFIALQITLPALYPPSITVSLPVINKHNRIYSVMNAFSESTFYFGVWWVSLRGVPALSVNDTVSLVFLVCMAQSW